MFLITRGKWNSIRRRPRVSTFAGVNFAGSLLIEDPANGSRGEKTLRERSSGANEFAIFTRSFGALPMKLAAFSFFVLHVQIPRGRVQPPGGMEFPNFSSSASPLRTLFSAPSQFFRDAQLAFTFQASACRLGSAVEARRPEDCRPHPAPPPVSPRPPMH